MGEIKKDMSDIILVTIVMPIYNVEKYVESALDSILSQSYKNLEIILINDGSTDKSQEICEKYLKQDKRIVLINQPNLGLSEARNSGLKVASGMYIYFFDSDDLLQKDTIKICLNRAEKNNLDLVLFDAISFDDKTLEEVNINKYILGSELKEENVYIGEIFLNKKNYLSPVWLKFIKLDIIKNNKLNFYPQILHEDELFTPLLLRKCKRVGYVNEIFFRRRLRENSIMTSDKSEKNIIGYLIVNRELKKIKDKKVSFLIKNNLQNIITTSIELGLERKYFKIIKEEFKYYLTKRQKFYIYFTKIYKVLKKIKRSLNVIKKDFKKNPTNI